MHRQKQVRQSTYIGCWNRWYSETHSNRQWSHTSRCRCRSLTRQRLNQTPQKTSWDARTLVRVAIVVATVRGEEARMPNGKASSNGNGSRRQEGEQETANEERFAIRHFFFFGFFAFVKMTGFISPKKSRFLVWITETFLIFNRGRSPF